MFRILLFSTCFLFSLSTYAQRLAEIATVEQEGRWIELHTDLNESPQAFLTTFKEDLGLTEADDFHQVGEEKDHLGFTHNKFNQHFNGIPVEGAQYIVHQKSGKIIRSNGRAVSGIYMPTEALIDANQAIDLAMLYMDAERYYWQDAQKEALVKRIKKDADATFYPQPELVYADRTYSQDGTKYRLAWKMDVYAEGPKGKKTIFVDARDGHILYEVEGCQEVTVEGQGQLRYHGLQTFMTDSVGPGEYRLRDNSRLADIETYDLNTFNPDTIEGAVDFFDDDNFWDNANAEFDDAGPDVHWGMQQTYDYFADKHGRISYDGNASPIISYVHVRQNWFNARWTGMWAEFGDGSDNPLTSVDVVSHELTHGVTGTSSGLVYMNESGALNESFSDIFGVAVEFFAIPDSADWLMGKENFQFRSISDPNSMGDPDTYFGDNWFTGDGDNGGVHTNSGVQNFWFYLLTEGGTGMNDLGSSYTVKGLGIDTAAAIAYRNLTTYLTVSSTYFDARYGAILSAEDLYGPCSEAVEEVISAWHAVGVGPNRIIRDMEIMHPSSPPTHSCSFSDTEEITINMLLRRSGCQNGIEAGTKLPIGYSINGGTPVLDTITLTEDFIDGETMSYTFPSPVDLSAPAYYDFDFFATFPDDENTINDVLRDFTVASVKTLDENIMILFNEFNRPAEPPYFIEFNEHSIAETSRDAAKSGLRGFLMSGLNVQRNSIDYAETEEENFTKNPEYESRLCMCINATAWDSLSIAFDLRQGYSEVYSEFVQDVENPNLGIALRLLADEVPVSQQYHPDSLFADTFVRQTVNLDHLAGTAFNLCFQGKHFFSKADDFRSTDGDFSHIDNVELITKETLSSTQAPNLESYVVTVYPNPAHEQVTIQWNDAANPPRSMQFMDLQGRLLNQINSLNANSWTFDLAGYASGIYFVEVQTDQGRIVKKILVE